MKLELTQGRFAIIDEEDFDKISMYKWCAAKGRNTFYAVSRNDKGKTIFMHRLIMGISENNILVDHRNGNGLDNRKLNIRKSTHKENMRNKKPRVGSSSKYLGVSWCSKMNKWRSQIKANNKTKYIGSFDSEVEAAKSYDLKAIELFGEFANPNFK